MTKPTNLQEKPFSGRDENGLISLQEAVEAELEKIFESGGIKKYNGQYWDGNDEYTCDDLVKQIKSSLLRIAKEAEKKERERIEKIIRNERKKYWQSSNGADTKAQQTWVLSDLLHKITTNETTK